MTQETLIGTCGLCGGPVYLPHSMGKGEPQAACKVCKAVVAVRPIHGPILTMAKPE